MDFAVQDVPVPACPPGGMLVRVLACGLCGSDLRTLRSGHHRVRLPYVIGHETSAEVVEVAPDAATASRPGERLSIGPLAYCGRCRFCADGRFELCEEYREIGQAWPGGLAQYMAVPAEAVRLGTIRRFGPDLDPAVATLAEPLSSCILAQEKGAIGLGDNVAILGGGPVGCMHLLLARTRGANLVLMADVSPQRLALCRNFAPDHLLDASDPEFVSKVRSLTGGRGPDCVIVANPSPQSQVQAVEMAGRGGRVLLFGGLPPEQARPGINTNRIHYNALTVTGTTIFAPRHHRTALDLLAGGRVDGRDLITHRLPLDQFAYGADLALRGQALKVVFVP